MSETNVKPIATFRSYAGLLAASLPVGTIWVVLASDGTIQQSGWISSSGIENAPLKSGAYVPFATLADGNYGYSIDTGGTIITEDANGLLVEMTGGDAWEITLTGIAPTTGAFSWVQSVHLWCTFTTPVVPTDTDEIYIRQVTDANNWSAVALRYVDDGTAAWEVNSQRYIAGVLTENGYDAPTLNGQMVFGAQWTAAPGAAARTYRSVTSELWTDPSNGATNWGGPAMGIATGENVAAFATTQTIKIGGVLDAASTSFTVRLHGLRVVQHPVVCSGVPF